jgi:hypothetical protein
MVTNNRTRHSSCRRFVPCLEVLEGRTLPSTFTVLNLADSGQGGNGLGGAYNDATSSLTLQTSSVTKNDADGGDGDHGGANGEGIGGGVYNLGTLDVDALTVIFENHASTNHDDLFS